MERTSCPHGVHLVAAYIQCKVIIADVVKNDGVMCCQGLFNILAPVNSSSVRASIVFVALACY